jgi:hypothetical protein
MAMVLAYRSDEDVLQARLGGLLASRSVEMASVGDAVRGIYSRRVARAVAGGVAAAGGLATLVSGAIRCIDTRSLFGHDVRPGDGRLTAALVGSMIAGALAYAPARHLARRAFDRSMHKALSLSGNARIDLVRMERAQPRRLARDLIARNEASSAALPLVAAALVAPLALHLVVWLLSSLNGAWPRIGAFDAWIAMSAPIAGLAHVVLALLAALFGMRLRGKSTAELRIKPAQEGWFALGITCVAGMMPGALLILIPPILIGATGLVFIPVSFYLMNRAIVREREAVEALDA